MRRRDFDDIFDMIREEMEDMFGEIGPIHSITFGPRRALPGRRGAEESALQEDGSFRKAFADHWETEKEFVATVELPGVDKKDIDIKAEEGALEIKVEKQQQEDKTEKEGEFHMRRYAGFYRKIPLPENTLPDESKATYKNGILEIRIPKIKEEKKRRKRIDVN